MLNIFDSASIRPVAQAAISIDVPVAIAYEYVKDLETMPAWFPGVSKIKGNGKQYVEYVDMPLLGVVSEVSLYVSFEKLNERIIVIGDYDLLCPRSEVTFEAQSSNSCRVYWRMDSIRDGNLLWRTAFPFAQVVMTNRGKNALRKLKSILENS